MVGSALIAKRAHSVVAACIAIFVVATLFALPNMPSAAEIAIFRWFNDLPSGLAPIMRLATEAGNLPHSFLVWLTAALVIGGRLGGMQILVGGVGAAVLGRLAKDAISRGRPEDLLSQLHLYAGNSDGYGFPSGHSTFVAVCVTILIFHVKPSFRPLLIALAIIVGISRLYLGAHLPLDVIGGWALGIACGLSVILAWRFLPVRFQFTQPGHLE